MKSIKARITKGVQKGSFLPTCDNSGAKIVRVISFIGYKGVKSRNPLGGVGDIINCSVQTGLPDMRKKVVFAIIVRQKKEYRRADGTRIKFEDNAAIVLKDEKGNPKGKIFKGPIAKEAADRWPAVAKLARIVI